MGSMTIPRRTLMGWFLLAARGRGDSKEKWLRVAPGAPMVKGFGGWNGYPECAKSAAASLELQALRKTSHASARFFSQLDACNCS